jgi:hypothetical protein
MSARWITSPERVAIHVFYAQLAAEGLDGRDFLARFAQRPAPIVVAREHLEVTN